jgi:cysteinyl-tRNA synthetase
MRLYSTAHRAKVELPDPPGPIRMYFCGPTVYQRIHIGNARPFLVSMWLRRWLEHRGYDVTLVENITDINDKIYLAAPGDSARLAADAARWYIEDTDLLGLGRPDHEPKATDSVPEIVELIGELVDRGLAYPAGGDVYFRVASFPDYGALSGRVDAEGTRNPSEEQEAGELKEDPRDFALWKAHKEGEDTSWESAWGPGRPGWHIECSAMAEKFLGPAFEIHGGGLDLVFPHHENEIAQSRGAGREFAKIWMHNGMLRLAGEKMSKSVGNIVSLRDAVEQWGRETVLLFFMTAHWSKPMDFSDETMAQAQAQLQPFKHVHRVVPGEVSGQSWEEFVEVLDDDFNTPQALAILHGWRASGETELLARGLSVFGIELDRVDVTVKVPPTGRITAGGVLAISAAGDPPQDVYDLVRRRHEARQKRNFNLADEVRRAIERGGWEVQDIGPSSYRLVPKP